MSEEYCVNRNEDAMQKCSVSQLMGCEVSADEDQISVCNPAFTQNAELLLSNNIAADQVTAYLASSGMAGIAAAAAISSSRRRNKTYTFENIPAVRKRQYTRLVRKLQHLLEEFCGRVGQQAVVVICNPKVATKPDSNVESPNICTNFKVYGSSPLDTVMRNIKPLLIQELDNELRKFQMMHEQSIGGANSSSNQQSWRGNDALPPLMVDGIPTPLDKMTQAQLRAFIPVMLKYSTGKGKPGWGRPHARPPWWPEDVPWANVRSDVRTTEEKAQVSWTAALKKVVRMCYEYHGREDLLADYSQNDQNPHHDVASSTRLLDMDSQHAVTDPSHAGVYALNMMHMGNSDTIPTSAHFPQIHPSYSFKTEKDGTLSIIRLENNSKPPEVASMEAAAALEDYNNESVNLASNEEINMQSFAASGDMVSLPAGTVMQLDSNSTAALLQIFANANANSVPKVSQIQHSSLDQNNHRQNNNL